MTNPKKLTFVFFVGLLIFFSAINLWMIAPYILSLLMAAVLAVLTSPLYRWLLSKKLSRGISASIVTLLIVVVVVVPVALFLSNALRQGMEIAEKLSDQNLLSTNSLAARISHWGVVDSFVGNIESLEKQLRSTISKLGGTMTQQFLALASSMPDIILQICITMIACFFFLTDGLLFLKWVDQRIPLDQDIKAELVYSFKNTTISVIWATLAAALAQALVIALGFIVLGVPNAALAAGATFIFAWIPILGSAPVALAGGIYLYIQGSTTKVVFMFIVAVVAGLIDNFVRPLVLNGRQNMHPLVSFVAIFGGIQLFGIFGVFLGPILAAVLIALLNAWPLVARRFGIMNA